MNRAVIRVFFSNGLYKTASIDDTVTAEELCRMIARKLAIERRVCVPVGDCTLFECRDDSPAPWKASQFGSTYRVVGMGELPFEIIRGWVEQLLTACSRFVMVFKEQQQQQQQPSTTTAAATETAPQHANKAWRPSATLQISDLLPGTLGEQSPQPPHVANSTATTTTAAPTTAPAAAVAAANAPAATTGTTPEPVRKEQRAGARSSVCLVKSGAGQEDAVVRDACLRFVNVQLRSVHAAVSSIDEFRSGHLIILLLESLTGLTIRPHHAQPRTKEESLANWAAGLKFLQSYGCSIRGAIPEDCYYGTETTIISVLAIILKHFQEMPAVTSALRKSIMIQTCAPAAAATTTTTTSAPVLQPNALQPPQPSRGSSTSTTEAKEALPEDFPQHPATRAPRPVLQPNALEMAAQQKELFLAEWERELQRREAEAAEHAAAVARRERDVAEREALLAQRVRELDDRERALALREGTTATATATAAQQPPAAAAAAAAATTTTRARSRTPSPGRTSSPSPSPTPAAASAASGTAPGTRVDGVPQRKGGAALLGMLQRRLTRAERPSARVLASASLSTAAQAANRQSELAATAPALLRVTVCARGGEAQVVSLRYQPELTVRALHAQVCTRRMLRPDDWVLKFANVDVTCAPELTIGELGVVALRLCPRAGRAAAAADLAALCAAFDAVVDTDAIPELSSSLAERRSEALGMRQSTFDLATIQEAQSRDQK